MSTRDDVANILVFGTREPTNGQVRREFQRLAFQFGCLGFAAALAAPVLVLLALQVPAIAVLGWAWAVAMGVLAGWAGLKARGLWRVAAAVAAEGNG